MICGLRNISNHVSALELGCTLALPKQAQPRPFVMWPLGDGLEQRHLFSYNHIHHGGIDNGTLLPGQYGEDYKRTSSIDHSLLNCRRGRCESSILSNSYVSTSSIQASHSSAFGKSIAKGAVVPLLAWSKFANLRY